MMALRWAVKCELCNMKILNTYLQYKSCVSESMIYLFVLY